MLWNARICKEIVLLSCKVLSKLKNVKFIVIIFPLKLAHNVIFFWTAPVSCSCPFLLHEYKFINNIIDYKNILKITMQNKYT